MDTSSNVEQPKVVPRGIRDPIIRVNHCEITLRSRCGSRALVFPMLQGYGPKEYDIRRLQLWTHPAQQNRIDGHFLLRHLQDTDILETCLDLYDLEAIGDHGFDFFLKHFGDSAIYGWKSVVEDEDEMRVPCLCLCASIGRVLPGWARLNEEFSPKSITPRFPRALLQQ